MAYSDDTIQVVMDIFSLKTSPANIADGIQSASGGEFIDSGLAAANTLEAFGSVMLKAAEKVAPPLLLVNIINDVRHMQEDYIKYGKYTDPTLISAASNISAAIALFATGAAVATVGAPVALTIAVVGVVASAALSVYGLSVGKTDTVLYDKMTELLGQAFDLVAMFGGDIYDALCGADSFESNVSGIFNNLSGDAFVSDGELVPQKDIFVEVAGSLRLKPYFDTGYSCEPLISDLQARFHTAETTTSPLILDLDGDGVETISKAAGIHFDHDGNGFAETTGWVGKDDGLLVWDRNGNGLIDDGSELFGNNTKMANGQNAANGFAALAELDSNQDGNIDANDAAFTQLRIWKDADSDALLDAGELLSLGAANVGSLNTAFTNQNLTDTQGNKVLQVGNYTDANGVVRSMNDIWFAVDTARTKNLNVVEVSAEIAALPEVAGFGNVASLRQAMELDASGQLQTLVSQFATETDATKRQVLLDQIIFKWSGADQYSATSRGMYISDGRKLYDLAPL